MCESFGTMLVEQCLQVLILTSHTIGNSCHIITVVIVTTKMLVVTETVVMVIVTL